MPDVMSGTSTPLSGPGSGAGTQSGTPAVSPEQVKQAAGTAVEQGKDVIGEARGQLGSLASDAQQQVQEQGSVQKERAASGLRRLGDELTAMAGSESAQGGVATDLVQQAGTKAHDLAGWLDQRDPGALLDELRDLGRRKPGLFLLGALTAGVVAGRLTRGVVEEKSSTTSGDGGPASAAMPSAAAGRIQPGTRPQLDEIDLGGRP